MTIRCMPLRDAPDAAPLLARWFKAEWSDHYADHTLAEVQQDLPLKAEGELPLIVVAFRGERLCGTAALRARSIHAFDHLTPWLGGLLVERDSRRTGVATALIEAVAAAARARGAKALYAGTVEAHALFDKLGWRRIGEAAQEGAQVTVYERPL